MLLKQTRQSFRKYYGFNTRTHNPLGRGHNNGIFILVISALHRRGCNSEFSCFSTEPYVVGTQKNRLSETVLLSTKTKVYANE